MAINVPLNAQLQNATQLQQQIQNAVNSVRLNIGGAGGARALNSLSQPLGRLTGQADEFTKSLDAANARVLAFGASVGVVNALSNAFKQLVVATIDVEKTLADINVIFGKSGSEIKNFGKGIFDVAKQTGQSFQAVSKAALEFARQGLGVEDTLKRTNDALVLTRLTGLDTEKAVAGLTATINGFAKEALTTAQVVNSLAAVDQKFAVSAADLIDALNRSAGVAENAGVGFNELVGIVTALQERTARGGAVIGNAIKTIFTRIQRPEVLAQLQGLGVAVEDFNTGKLLSASEILKNLAGNVQALGEIQRAGVFEDVAGGFQINQLIALLNDLSGARSKAAEATKISTEATNQAYVANEQLNKTISALVNQTVEGLRELGATLGNLGLSDNIKSLLGVVNGFIDDVQTLFEGEGIGSKFAAGIIKGLGSVLSGPGLALFGVIISKLLIDLGKFAVQGLKTFLGIGKAAADQKALQDSIVQTLLRNEGAQRAILSLQGNQIAQAAVLAGIFNQQQAALTNIQRTAAGIAPTLFQAGLRGGPGGLTQGGRRAAGGYLPAAEASDVRRGVGGAPSNAQVVSIPNFAFGGGKRGTMIANTSEYIVPNFAGGGSAIFNQDMVRSMGLPKGAKKIRAAGGFIPNFAESNLKSDADFKPIDLKLDANSIGGIGMLTLDPNIKKNGFYSSGTILKADQVKENNRLTEFFKENNINAIELQNLKISSTFPGLKDRTNELSIQESFSEKVNNLLLTPFVKLSQEMFGETLKEFFAGVGSDFDTALINELSKKKESFLSPSAEGDLFERAIKFGLNAAQGAEKVAGVLNDNPNSPFDYSPKGPIGDKARDTFFGGAPIFKADAKRRNGTDDRKSMLRKVLTDQETQAKVFAKFQNLQLKFRDKAGGKIKEFSPPKIKEFSPPKNEELKYMEEYFRTGVLRTQAASGYIPNFAASALQEAIAREQAQSGLQPNQISVTKDPRLVNASNPNGLAVVNNRDEPNGRVPNFAAPAPINRDTTGAFAQSLPPSVNKQLTQFADLIDKLNKKLANGTITQDKANKELEDFVAAIRSGGRNLNPTRGVGSQAVQAGQRQLVPAQEKAAQGFGDLAGKIFLAQSALAFFNGALGDASSSAGKIAAAFTNLLGNVGSLGLVFSQLNDFKPEGTLGKLGKGLGMAGLAIGVAVEVFSFANQAIKEFSGENKRAAEGLAALESATQGAIISLNDLSPEGQLKAQQRGKDALKAFQGTFISGAGDNPEIQKQMGVLAASGLSLKDLEDIINNIVLDEVAKREGTAGGFAQALTNAQNLANKGGRRAVSEEVLKGAFLGRAEIGDLSQAIAKAFSDPKVIAAATKSAQIREGLKTGAFGENPTAQSIAEKVFGDQPTNEQLQQAESLLRVEQNRKQVSAAQIQNQRNLALGEKLSLAIAEEKLKSALLLKEIELDRNLDVDTAQLKIALETTDASKQYRNELEYQIKLKEIDANLSKEGLKIFQTQIESLKSLPSVNPLGIEKDKIEAIAGELQNLKVDNVDKLKEALDTIGKKFSLKPIDIQNIQAYFEGAYKNAEKLSKGEKDAALRAKELANNIADGSEKLARAANFANQLADNLRRAGDVQFSIDETGIREVENRLTILRAKLSAATTESDRTAIERLINQEDQTLNNLRQQQSQKQAGGERQALEALRSKAAQELSKRRLAISTITGQPMYNATEIEAAQKAFADADAALIKFNETQKQANGTFNTTSEALKIQAGAIGKVAGAYESLNEQLANFRRGAGGRVAGAQFSALGATDPDTLAKAAISSMVEGRVQAQGKMSDRDYYQSIVQGTALEEKRYELATETSEVRKLELGKELEIMQKIAEISGLSDEERLEKAKQIVAERTKESRSFGEGFARGRAKIQDDINNFGVKLGEEIPDLFSQNLAQGLNDAISGAKSLKEALMDAATSFFNAITQRNLQNIANIVTDSLTGGISGLLGGATKKASGGIISGGSGVKDDVPAMLMGGEYVVKKSAVQKYGSAFFDSLNNGKIQKFAKGGSVGRTQSGAGGFYTPGDFGTGSISGGKNLLSFATQSETGGQFDTFGATAGGASINLEPESVRLSMLGRENSPIFERVQQSKEEAFNVYKEGIARDKQYKDLLKEIDEREKARKKQLITSITMAVASAALNAGLSSFAAGASNAIGAAKAGATASGQTLSLGQRFMTGLKGGFGSGGMTGQGGLGNLFSGNFGSAFTNIGAMTPKGTNPYQFSPTGQYRGATVGNATYLAPNYFRRASGGYVMGGSGVKDDIPTMLTGGEFVLNNRATKNIGLQKLNQLNTAGSTETQSNNNSSELMNALIAKFDELIQVSGQNGSKDNVVVNVSGADQSKSEEEATSNNKELQKKIKQAVLDVLAQEKRLGGSLGNYNKI